MSDIPVIELVRPMPGFPDVRRFALVELDDSGALCALRSVDHPDLRFLVVAPRIFFPDYEPEIDDETVTELGIGSVDEVLLLVVLTAGASLAETTANLLAPVLVNTTTLRACQVVLDDTSLPISAPVLA